MGVGVADLLRPLEPGFALLEQPQRPFVGIGPLVEAAPERDVRAAGRGHGAVTRLAGHQVNALERRHQGGATFVDLAQGLREGRAHPLGGRGPIDQRRDLRATSPHMVRQTVTREMREQSHQVERHPFLRRERRGQALARIRHCRPVFVDVQLSFFGRLRKHGWLKP